MLQHPLLEGEGDAHVTSISKRGTPAIPGGGVTAPVGELHVFRLNGMDEGTSAVYQNMLWRKACMLYTHPLANFAFGNVHIGCHG